MEAASLAGVSAAALPGGAPARLAHPRWVIPGPPRSAILWA